MTLHRLLIIPLMLLGACSVDPAAPTLVEDIGFHMPVAFHADCAQLAKLDAPPPTLTVRDYFACLTPESRAALDLAYQKRLARRAVATAPASLDDLIALHGDTPISGSRLRDLAFGGGALVDVKGDGPAITPTLRSAAAASSFGLDPATCEKSCLSVPVDVVGDTRVIGYHAADVGPGADAGGRLLDEIYPGTIPDHNQNNLANSELVASGCGPVSAVNLFEWWNIPVWNGGSRLTTFDARAEFIAGRMDTLDGLNFTDDGDLFDFMTSYPKELYAAGRIPGYPGSHYMTNYASAWPVMLSYVARGWPVIALYSTGSMSLHWAVILGYQDGKLRIANAGDRTLADFYEQWAHWGSLAWYADWASDLFVDPYTFFAYTGWNQSGSPPPDRVAARGSSSNPGYVASGTAYRFRYCAGTGDDIADGEASGGLSGGCMFASGMPSFGLTGTPAGGAASSKKGTTLTLTAGPVSGGANLQAFLDANPGAHCNFYGKSGGDWTSLAVRNCDDAGAFQYSFVNVGQYSEVTFQIHAADLAHVTWTISAN